MAQESKPVLIALLLCLMIAKGNCVCLNCMNYRVEIRQVAGAPGMVGGENTRFTVTVTNRCCCEVRNVVVFAPGFRSAVPVDPKLFRDSPDGRTDYFLLGDGETIRTNGSVTFSYAWQHMFRMNVNGMTVFNCS
uniref:Late embryogenesis abundant protein LEA-2 subgroup domain-containing protein n=1 Tax=Leersia perrieri TaxID=77586 RepID=A0A0D9XZ57_9ORYZ